MVAPDSIQSQSFLPSCSRITTVLWCHQFWLLFHHFQLSLPPVHTFMPQSLVSPVKALMPPVLTPASTSPGFYATSLLCHQSRLLCYQSDVSPVQASMPLELAPATVSPTQASMPPVCCVTSPGFYATSPSCCVTSLGFYATILLCNQFRLLCH